MKTVFVPNVPAVWRTIAAVSLTIAFAGCGQKGAETTSATAPTETAGSIASQVTEPTPHVSDAFPASTELGDLGLPVYPIPKDNIMVNPTETNPEGVKSESMTMEPHDSFATVAAWYKERMPNGSAQDNGGNPDHLQFQIGKEGDKVIRMVILDQIRGHQGTHLILMRKTAS